MSDAPRRAAPRRAAPRGTRASDRLAAIFLHYGKYEKQIAA